MGSAIIVHTSHPSLLALYKAVFLAFADLALGFVVTRGLVGIAVCCGTNAVQFRSDAYTVRAAFADVSAGSRITGQ